jgi:hypothetical protein
VLIKSAVPRHTTSWSSSRNTRIGRSGVDGVTIVHTISFLATPVGVRTVLRP